MNWDMPNYLRAPLYVLAFAAILVGCGFGIWGIHQFWLFIIGPDAWDGEGAFAASTGTIVFFAASFVVWVIMEDS